MQVGGLFLRFTNFELRMWCRDTSVVVVWETRERTNAEKTCPCVVRTDYQPLIVHHANQASEESVVCRGQSRVTALAALSIRHREPPLAGIKQDVRAHYPWSEQEQSKATIHKKHLNSTAALYATWSSMSLSAPVF